MGVHVQRRERSENEDVATHGPPAVERITVSLTSRVARELKRLRLATGLSKTDLINRAISLYALAEHEIGDGRELAFYDPETREYKHVHLA